MNHGVLLVLLTFTCLFPSAPMTTSNMLVFNVLHYWSILSCLLTGLCNIFWFGRSSYRYCILLSSSDSMLNFLIVCGSGFRALCNFSQILHSTTSISLPELVRFKVLTSNIVCGVTSLLVRMYFETEC